MTLSLELPADLAQQLEAAAQCQGVSPEQLALRVLQDQLVEEERRRRTVELVQSWIDADDADEQRETGEFLIRALDEDRPADGKLFPPELKGISW